MKPAITFDIDWAPECAIDLTANMLLERGIKSTWFVTHLSPAVERLRARPDLVELGIHPNFMPGSSHGTEPEKVLTTCMGLVPDAVSVRTHGLVQSGYLLDLVMSRTPITSDASLFLPLARDVDVVKYERFGRVLWRVPYVWEDDYVMQAGRPDAPSDARLSGFAEGLAQARGIQVFNFHPIHVLLNSNSMKNYEAMKHAHPSLWKLTESEVSSFVERERAGTMTALLDLVFAVEKKGGGSFVKELHE